MREPFPPTREQLAVIHDRGRNLLVLAGPGTGKTETLARRFASLVADGISPSRILVLSFSRRSAEAMRARILVRLRERQGRGLATRELFVQTFHSFCARLLDGDQGRQRQRALLTPVRERLLWRELMRSGGLQFSSLSRSVLESSQFATDCLNIIGQLKGRGIDASAFSRFAQGHSRLADVALAYSALEQARVTQGLHDFRDLVNEAEKALRDPASPPSLRLKKIDFAHVLVDEFQDSDPMQLHLLQAMRALLGSACFCFVGDTNQSIYRFRGATPENVELAGKAFGCAVRQLTLNRRSAAPILEVANAVAGLDPDSLTVAEDEKKPGSVTFRRPRTVEDEVAAVCEAILQQIASGTAPENIAVLLRQIRPYQQLVIDALSAAGVPVAPQPAAGFAEDSLIDAVLTGLRILALPGDFAAWRRLLCNPILGYHPIGVQTAFDEARRGRITDPRAALRRWPPQGRRPASDFLRAWHHCERCYARAAPFELVQTMVRELDLLAPMREPGRIDGFDRAASPARLEALLQSAFDYDAHLGAAGAAGAHADAVSDFISRLDETLGLLADATAPPPNAAGGVRVITIHAAKGLEFDFVAIPRLVDGVFPAPARANRLLPESSLEHLRRAGVTIFVDDDQARREEHSLWYVALTRARREVFVSAPMVDDDGADVVVSGFAQAIEGAQGRNKQITQPSPTGAGLALDAPVNGVREKAAHAADNGAPPVRISIESVSPTSITNFIACPRRFYYGDVLHLPKHEDEPAQQGLRLHDVLRRFHEAETNFSGVGDPAEAQQRFARALCSLADVPRDTTGETRCGPLERFARSELAGGLSQYARKLADEAAHEPFWVLGCEVAIASSSDGLTIRGKVDRVDRLAGGGLVIRDYKSGRMRGTLASAVREAFAQLDRGGRLFGAAPEGLNLQTILYLPAVEQAFGEPVRRLDYIYFRGRSIDDPDLRIDSTWVRDEEAPSVEGEQLTRADLVRARRELALPILELCRSGGLRVFWTTENEQLCTFCDFARVCPGFGSIPP